jgi:cobalt/nickel transport system permease protein
MEERFAQGGSFIHKRDPRGKIVIATLFITAVALAQSFVAVSAALFVAFVLVLLSRISLVSVFKRILLLNSFTLFLWVSLPLTFGGSDTISFASLSLSRDGVLLAALITLKTNSIVFSIIALLSTSTIADLGHALDKLLFPKKLCFILLFSYRYIFVIYQEYNRLLRAAKMRCFSPKTNIHTYRTFAYLYGMTLVNSYNRSQRVHQAMLLRGFNGQLKSLQRYTFTQIDIAFISICILCTCCIVFLNVSC